MGYTTEFEGKFTISPPLSYEQMEYLKEFSETRHMRLNAKLLISKPDPVREAAKLPVGEEGMYCLKAEYKEIVDYNMPPAGAPSLWCDWAPVDNSTLAWNGAEKFYDYAEWLQFIISHFLKPWGRTLSGVVSFQGENHSDRGIISVTDNNVIVTHSEDGPRVPELDGY